MVVVDTVATEAEVCMIDYLISLKLSFFSLKDREDQTDTIFVSGLPDDVDENELARFFGSIGIIKVSIIMTLK